MASFQSWDTAGTAGTATLGAPVPPVGAGRSRQGTGGVQGGRGGLEVLVRMRSSSWDVGRVPESGLLPSTDTVTGVTQSQG